MKKILIFSGTTEGRLLSESLSAAGIGCTVCVATDYGQDVMKDLKNVDILRGRQDQEQMLQLMQQTKFTAVVDATHPYAVAVSENIMKSASKASLPYLRLQRNTKFPDTEIPEVMYFDQPQACASFLESTKGAVLLTTGSKALDIFCKNEALKERLTVRVLPGEESLAICRKLGLSGKQILALQGPFSENLNRAFLREYHIQYMVTKESGRSGGYMEKVMAARKEKVCLCVIGNPEKTPGLSFEEVLERLQAMTGVKLIGGRTVTITLAGVGMGNPLSMTAQVQKAVDTADYLFGAKRLIEPYRSEKKTKPYYLAGDVIPEIERILEKNDMKQALNLTILFSGDSGFYSGAQAMERQLEAWKNEREKTDSSDRIEIKIDPGISSVAYMAAACKTSWQDARILSIHGKGECGAWASGFLDAVKYHEKTFVLLSNVQNLKDAGALLEKHGMSGCSIYAGYRLSYPEECITRLTPVQCSTCETEGLYTCLILNPDVSKRCLTYGLADEQFIRGSVPMTKSEVRAIILSKLALTMYSNFYDIGSGTGSIAVEAARLLPEGRVWAIEQNEAATRLIRENCRQFGLENVSIIHAKAPEGMSELPPVSHAFIGGSSGNLKQIVETLYQKNPRMRVVISAITLETIAELKQMLLERYIKDEELIQIMVSRSKKAGKYHLMQSENPVYICAFNFSETNE